MELLGVFGFAPAPAAAPEAPEPGTDVAKKFAIAAPAAAPSSSPAAPPSFRAEELRLLQEPTAFADYGAAHERALAYMRWRRDAAVVTEPGIAPSAEMASDARLMRFLVAKSFDCAGAAEMYIGALRWRPA